MNYRDAILKVIEHEGGDKITDNPLDTGGLTKYGISQRAYPTLDIRNLTLDQAVAIYKRDYWDKIRGDEIKLYPIAFAIFDQAVNRGVASAVKQAQRVVGAVQDGVMGPNTLAAINAQIDRNFSASYLSLSEDFYKSIVANNPTQSVFLKGWLNRISSVKSYTDSFIGVIADNKDISIVVVAVIGFFLTFIIMSKRKA